jgi:hypothetical protein
MSTIGNMNIEKQMIDQRINKIIEDNIDLFASYSKDAGKQISYAFLLLGVAAFLDIDIADALQYITEGGQDGGFDAAYIAQANNGALQVVLFQSKYKRELETDFNFPANTIEKSINTVKNIFDPKRVIELNERSQTVVKEIQSYIADGFIPEVNFVMLSNGAHWTNEAQAYINNEFFGQKQVIFEHYNHHDILRYINKHNDIDETITLTGLAIKEDFNYKEVILGRIKIEEITRIIEKHGDNLLDRNIRKYLGTNPVNNAIRETLLTDSQRSNFFFFNNGITVICRDFKYNALQKEDWKVKIRDMQIINGGQTCKTIYQTCLDNPNNDYSQATVLLRLYAVGDNESIIEGITRATNSQNPVDFRDLKSNDSIQINLEVSAQELGYVYKRKRDNQAKTDIIPSSVAAEAVFAVWRKKPHLAKYKKVEFFNAYYDEIFKDLNASQMIIAVLVFRMCDSYRKKSFGDQDIKSQRGYSQYLLAAMIGKRILEHFKIDLSDLTHKNFNEVRNYFIDGKDIMYDDAEKELVEYLKKYFPGYATLYEIDGRSMAAAFRRFDFVEKVLSGTID